MRCPNFFTVYSFVLSVLYEKVRNLEEKSYYVMRALTEMRLITTDYGHPMKA